VRSVKANSLEIDCEKQQPEITKLMTDLIEKNSVFRKIADELKKFQAEKAYLQNENSGNSGN
jgi:hypothetical protein